MDIVDNKGASAEAIQYHYDVGNAFYEVWLDASMTYSAALWPDEESVDTSLAEAQNAKLDWHIDRLNLKAGDRLLDVGCGWGSLMRRAIERRQLSRAIGLTLSNEQARWINAKPGQAPIDVLIRPWQEFRADSKFDGITSIGAMEHFARPGMTRGEKIQSYSAFFEFCHTNLVAGGRLSLQTITWMNIRPEQERSALPEHIFPQSNLPHLVEIVAAAEPWFHITEMHNRPRDYSRTLRKWVESIRANKAELSRLHGTDVIDRYISGWGKFIIAFQRDVIGLSRLRLLKRQSGSLLDRKS